MLRAAMTPVDHGPAWPARKLDTVRGASLRKTARKFLSSFSPGRRARIPMRANEQGRVHGLSSLNEPPRLLCSPFHRRKRCSESSRLPRFRDAGLPPRPHRRNGGIRRAAGHRLRPRVAPPPRSGPAARFLSFPSPASWEPGGGDGFLAGFDSFWADFLTRRRGSCRSRWITSTSRTPPMAGA